MRWRVAAIQKRVYGDPLHALAGDQIEQREDVILVAVHATGTEQAEHVQGRTPGCGASPEQRRIVEKAAIGNRGVNLVRVARRWTFRTAADLGWLLSREKTEQKKLSRAAIETLAIIAYHQPTTRAEIEDIRGVAISRGTLDVLLETGWVRLRGRRRAPGRPVTYGTTDAFLLNFGLETLGDLPGLDELRGSGMFDGRLPAGFGVPQPKDDPGLAEDEDPLEDGAVDLFDDPPLEAETGPGPAAETSAEVESTTAAESEPVQICSARR